MPDRIEIGTYMIAAAITGSELFLSGGTCDYLTAFIDVLRQMGVIIQQLTSGVTIKSPTPKELQPASIRTGPYPDFPTDLQAPIMALLALIPGKSYESNYFGFLNCLY